VAELKADLEDTEEEKGALEAALSQANGRMAELGRELNEARAATDAAHRLVDDRDADLRDADRQLEEAAARAASDLRAANERASAAERAIAGLQADMRALKDQTRVRELEEALAAAQAALADVSAQRDQMAGLMDAQNEQLEAAAAELRELQERREELVAEAVRSERRRLEDAQRQLGTAGVTLQEERDRYAELMSQKAEVEMQLQEARTRLVRARKWQCVAAVPAASLILLQHPAPSARRRLTLVLPPPRASISPHCRPSTSAATAWRTPLRSRSACARPCASATRTSPS
jgi:chromosome segregation ATPase